MLQVGWCNRGGVRNSLKVQPILSFVTREQENNAASSLLLHLQHTVRECQAMRISKESLISPIRYSKIQLSIALLYIPVK